MHWKIKTLILIIISAILIGYPFFAIRYFETEIPLKITLTYFLPPILVLLLIFSPGFYFKKVKPLDNFHTDSKIKEKTRDILSIVMMILCSGGVFFGIFFSLIVTTNSFYNFRKSFYCISALRPESKSALHIGSNSFIEPDLTSHFPL